MSKPIQLKKPSPFIRLANAYQKKKGLRLTAHEVQSLVLSDNALQSLIEGWSK